MSVLRGLIPPLTTPLTPEGDVVNEWSLRDVIDPAEVDLAAFVLTVGSVNEAPTDITLDSTNVSENADALYRAAATRVARAVVRTGGHDGGLGARSGGPEPDGECGPGDRAAQSERIRRSF